MWRKGVMVVSLDPGPQIFANYPSNASEHVSCVVRQAKRFDRNRGLLRLPY